MRKKKWLSALAAAAMMLMLIPISAFAQEVDVYKRQGFSYALLLFVDNSSYAS